MNKTLFLGPLICVLSQSALAQMSMQDQIAAVRAAEIQIEQLEAQKAQEAALVAKRAADIQRRATLAKARGLKHSLIDQLKYNFGCTTLNSRFKTHLGMLPQFQAL